MHCIVPVFMLDSTMTMYKVQVSTTMSGRASQLNEQLVTIITISNCLFLPFLLKSKNKIYT